MGNCCTGTFPEILDTVEYEGCVTIKIKVRENRRNQVVGRDIVRFNLEPPTNQKNESYDFDYLHFFVSSCVLPGLDPRRAEHRECQDSLFFIVESDKILLGLFDGHGKYGTQVVDFCCKYMKTYFKNNHEDFETSPESSLEEMVKSCDEKIRSSKDEVNCSTSGTTALLVYIDRTGIHIASVGDSRSILGTRSDIPPDQRDRSSSKNSYLRKIDAGIQLNVLTLSVDQKPNHETEYERIKSCNGIVEQITDDFGNKAGPYRVWDKNGRGQGLAMSRSIGDQLSKNLGVISEPVYNHFDYIPSRDKFIVMASDGVWDVMDNDEVVSFVEKFRTKCAKRHQDPNYPHKAKNSTISHFLAEEARFRWYGICEDEDVKIDDISVIVLEFDSSKLGSIDLDNIKKDTRESAFFNTAIIPCSNKKVITSASGRFDASRSSTLQSDKPSTNRVDTKRGSTNMKETDEEEDEQIEDKIEECLNRFKDS